MRRRPHGLCRVARSVGHAAARREAIRFAWGMYLRQAVHHPRALEELDNSLPEPRAGVRLDVLRQVDMHPSAALLEGAV